MRFNDAVKHPSFCPRQDCSDPATGDIVHREPRRASVTPSGDHTRPLGFALVQADESVGDRQVEHEPEVAMFVGDDPIVLSLDQFATMLRDGCDTLTRGQQCLRGYPSSA